MRLGDGLWLRLVDLDAALKARSYRPGAVRRARGDRRALSLERRAATASATTPAAPRTRPTSRSTSPTSPRVYLGAFDFHRLAHAGLVDERVEGAAEAATLLFRTDLPPYCPEVF